MMNFLQITRPLYYPLVSRQVIQHHSIRLTSHQSCSGQRNKVNKSSDASFLENHSLYEQVRPSFDYKLVSQLFQDLGLLNPDRRRQVMELAVGTGKFSKAILDHGIEKVHQTSFIEPNEGMLESFQKKYPDLYAKRGSSYQLPCIDNSVDAIIIAQGFHWFDDIESIAEMHRVLRKGGKLGLIWNFDAINNNSNLEYDSVEFKVDKKTLKETKTMTDISEFVQEHDFTVPRYRDARWRKVFESEKGREYFDYENAIDRTGYRTIPFTVNKVYEYWLSRSYVTLFDEESKVKLKEGIEDIISKAPEESFFTSEQLKQFLGTHYFVVEVNK